MNLILFFTYGNSLETWAETGLLDREILLYKKLIENGFKITFITYGKQSDYQYRDKLGEIKIIPFYAFVKRPSNKIIRFIQSFFLPFILRDQLKKADILKTNQMSMTWAPLIAKLIYRKKLVVRCGFEWYRTLIKGSSSPLIKLFVYLTEWLSYHIADGIILTSEDNRQYIISRFRIKNKDKIEVIPNYIDAYIFKPIDNGKKKNYLLFVGRLSREKNLFNLFNAIKESQYTLDIVGDGELKDDLMSCSSKNRIKVNFLGRFPNNRIPDLLNQYEVFVLVSYFEGNPKSLLEAMSCELAVIGADVDGINSIIKDKENGYLCKTDSKSIRKAIDTVMEDELLRKRIGTQARKYIINNCRIDEIVIKELNLCNAVLRR